MNCLYQQKIGYLPSLILAILLLAHLGEASETCLENQTIDSVRFDGLRHVAKNVVEREFLLPPGQDFSKELAEKQRSAYLDMDLFASVEYQCEKQDTVAGQGATLVWKVRELFQHLLAPNAKKTDQDGWMPGASIASLNLGGQDIRMEFAARASLRPLFDAKEFAIYASSPWLAKWPLQWNVDIMRIDSWDPLRGFHDREWFAEAEGTFWNQGPQALRRWGFITDAGYRRLELEHSADVVPFLGVGAVADSRNAQWDPRSGTYSEVRVVRHGERLGGVGDWTEWLADGRLYVTLGGSVLSAAALGRYRPGDMRFYDRIHQGGPNSLRAFIADSLRYGQHEMLHNIELRRPWIERRPIRLMGLDGYWGLQAVTGVDVAWLGDAQPDFNSGYREAVYAGLHLLLPAIDRLRIEAGFAPRTHEWSIAVGMFDKVTTQRWRGR